jgi:hypothetical protein
LSYEINIAAYRKTIEEIEGRSPWVLSESAHFGKVGSEFDFKNGMSLGRAQQQLDEIKTKLQTLQREVDKQVIVKWEEAQRKIRFVELTYNKITGEREKFKV